MSAVVEATAGIQSLEGSNTYVHPVPIPKMVCAGEEFGDEVSSEVLLRLDEIADRVAAKSPLMFPTRRFGDLNAKEVESVYDRQSHIVATTFMSLKADPAVGRQLLTFAICRWGHKTKRFAAIYQTLEIASPGTMRLWLRTIEQHATPVAPPTYLGTRDTA